MRITLLRYLRMKIHFFSYFNLHCPFYPPLKMIFWIFLGLIGSIPLQLFEFTDLPLQFIILKLCHCNLTYLFGVFHKIYGPKYPWSCSSSNPPSSFPSLHGQTSSAADHPHVHRSSRHHGEQFPFNWDSIALKNGIQRHPVSLDWARGQGARTCRGNEEELGA